MSRRVVISGMGLLTPLGKGPREFFDNALKGKSVVRKITKFDTRNLRVKIAGEISGATGSEDLESLLPNVTIWTLAAARDAIKDAQLEPSTSNPLSMDVILGNSISNIETLNPRLFENGAKSLIEITPKELSRLNPAFTAAYLAQELGLEGEIVNLTTACSSSTSAIGYAVRLIQQGESDLVLTGGADEGVSPLFMGAFTNGLCLSTRNEQPESASRPFDRTRDGSVQADAACVLVLEEYRHALKRGAKIYAELSGFGSSGDCKSALKLPSSLEPGIRAIQKALKQACIETSEVDYYSALGVAHPWIDVLETRIIKAVFREATTQMPASSIRSMMGHPMGASGALQTAIGALSILNQSIHPTINYVEPDPECDLDCVPNEARTARVKSALIYTIGTGGNHSALILKAC